MLETQTTAFSYEHIFSYEKKKVTKMWISYIYKTQGGISLFFVNTIGHSNMNDNSLIRKFK